MASNALARENGLLHKVLLNNDHVMKPKELVKALRHEELSEDAAWGLLESINQGKFWDGFSKDGIWVATRKNQKAYYEVGLGEKKFEAKGDWYGYSPLLRQTPAPSEDFSPTDGMVAILPWYSKPPTPEPSWTTREAPGKPPSDTEREAFDRFLEAYRTILRDVDQARPTSLTVDVLLSVIHTATVNRKGGVEVRFRRIEWMGDTGRGPRQAERRHFGTPG